MNSKQRIGKYSAIEEKVNIITHASGLFLSVVALVLLILRALRYGDTLHVITFTVFGLSMILLYTASTLYHSTKDITTRGKLQVFDHASIYVLIAGTYTPFTLIVLPENLGWIMFGIIWTLALGGVIIKLFFTGRFDVVLTIMYVLLGWIVVVALKPLIANLAIEGVILLFAGGIAYTLGAVIYAIKKIPANHAIFHFFVLLGSLCHFLSIYFFVLPAK
jgi:hemolysin III